MGTMQLQKSAFVWPLRPNPTPLLARKDRTAFPFGLVHASPSRLSPYPHLEVVLLPGGRLADASQHNPSPAPLSFCKMFSSASKACSERQCFCSWQSCWKLVRGSALSNLEGGKARGNQQMDEKAVQLHGVGLRLWEGHGGCRHH